MLRWSLWALQVLVGGQEFEVYHVLAVMVGMDPRLAYSTECDQLRRSPGATKSRTFEDCRCQVV